MKLKTMVILALMVGLNSAWSYSYGDEYYGLTYHYTPQVSIVPIGGQLPYQPSYVKVIDDGVLYAMNVSGAGQLFCAYNITANTTLWCVDVGSYDGINVFYPFIAEDSMVVQLTGVNEVLIDETGVKYYNETSPDYYNWMGDTYYATPYYNNNTHMGLYFQTSDNSNYRRYFVNMRLEYYNSSLYKFPQPYNAMGSNVIAMRGVEAASDNPQHVAGMNKPIYDKTNNLIIQVGKQGNDGGYPLIYSYGNQTYVLKDPNIPLLKFNKGCWVDSSCNYSGTGYSAFCSKVGGIMNTSIYTCANDGQCGAGPAHHCQYVEAEEKNKCVSDTTQGSCVMTLNNSCIITIPTAENQRAYTYDYLTKMLYLFVEDGSHMIIYNQSVGACTFTSSTNLTASLFGSYGAGVSNAGTNYLTQSPIMDTGYIYITWTNSTGHYFQKIDRNTKAVVYSKALTRDIYNNSDSGDIGSLNNGYIGYDTASKDVYVFVDTDRYIKFGQINYTTCPNEDPHTADPMCYTNGTLNLINHQYCDTDVAPTESQPCVDKLESAGSCNRDWQCVDGATQGWCTIDLLAIGCAATDSPLNYNCSTGVLSWNQASAPPTGDFWFYEVVSGNESSLFDSSSVEKNLLSGLYDITNTSLNSSLSSELYYRVIAIDSYARRYWKTDIIKGSDVLPTTTTTSTTTSTTVSTTTSTSTSTSTTLTSGNYTLTVTADKTSYNLNETLTAEAFKAYFKFRGGIIEGDSCRFYIDDNVFLHSDVPDFGVMNYLPGSYYFKHNWVQVRDNISAQQTWINVTCSNGAFNIKNATNVSINGFQVGANPEVEFVDRLTEGKVGDYRYLTVRFKYANGTLITNATCDLYINDMRQAYSPSEQTNHLYQMIYAYPAVGYYEYSVTCTNDGWTTNYTKYDAFNITGTYGTTTTTTATTLPPSQCINKCAHDKVGCPPCSNGEGCDVDSECISHYCKPDTGTCQDAPTINCGRTPSGSYVNLCHCSDTLSLEGCRNDGSEHCNGTYCIPDSCLTDPECSSLRLWNENHTGTFIRSRICPNNWCAFKSSSYYPNSSTAPKIYPLSGITYYEGADGIYLAVCEDNTHGFRIITPVATTTSYQYYASSKTPAIPPSYLPKPFNTTRIEKTALLPELCGWSGTGGKYALIHFESVYQGGNPSFDNIYVRVEKQKFDVTAKVGTTLNNSVNFNLTRNGTCFIRKNEQDEYVSVSATSGISFDVEYYPLINSSYFYGMCNSTYGEEKTFSWHRLPTFEWKPYYTPLVFYIILLVVPTVILLSKRFKEKNND